MKKIIIVLCLLTMLLIYNETKEETITIPNSSIRLRVIPNSNSVLDQNMKIKVKEYLEENTYELLRDETNIEQARLIIEENIPNIEKNIDRIFQEEKYKMNYSVEYGYNYFPQKEYRGIKYDEGYYESIIIKIGNGEGDNWWCVLFPNFCLIDLESTEDNEYRSWIAEAINKIF